jgi:hypothetical protein
LSIQSPVQYFVFNIGQQIRGSLFMADALGIAAGTETGAQKDMMFGFVHFFDSFLYKIRGVLLFPYPQPI